MTPEEIQLKANALKDKLEGIEKQSQDNAEDVTKVRLALENVATKDDLTAINKDIDEMAKQLKGMSVNKNVKFESIPTQIKKALDTNKGKVEDLLEKKQGTVSFNINKASMNPTDIGTGTTRDSLGQLLPGIEHKPFRSLSILDLFRRVPTSKEFIRYWEQDTVTRDAKVVVACAESTHTTKVDWVERVLQITKIRDFVDVCTDMIDDYDFVASEVNQLLNESVKSKEESEILLGTGTGTSDILSIETISSEFDAANVLAPYTGAFQAPTLAELTAAMKAQIYTFGQQNKWEADTILMNYNDYVKFQHQKNANNDYLLPNFVLTNGNILNGMRVVTSPLVSPNTLYVFDSKLGEIIDRQQVSVEMFYENNDNAEKEIVTIKAVERLQFHVKLINRDAFMKCTDIETALSALTVTP